MEKGGNCIDLLFHISSEIQNCRPGAPGELRSSELNFWVLDPDRPIQIRDNSSKVEAHISSSASESQSDLERRI